MATYVKELTSGDGLNTIYPKTVSEAVYHNLSEKVEKLGVIYTQWNSILP